MREKTSFGWRLRAAVRDWYFLTNHQKHDPARDKRSTLTRMWISVCVAMLLASGCVAWVGNESNGSTTPQLVEASPNVLLIVVDTLRADRLQFEPGSSARTPRFNALKAESVWFKNAYATSSWTLPSTASLFTSKWVSDHRVSSWGSRLGMEQETLVEVFAQGGYRTGMWTANRVVAGRRGFAARFDRAELVVHPDFAGGSPLSESAFANAAAVVDRAQAWLTAETAGPEEEASPFFAYLHLMEPHAPYLCAADAEQGCVARAVSLNRKLLNFEWDLTQAEQAFLGELYDAELSRTDQALSGLIEGMEEADLLENTWVVVVADHGELLGEEGMYAHGRTLLDAILRVPLLIRSPKGRADVVSTPVSLIDIAPTLVDVAGLKVPAGFSGQSLRLALEGGHLSPRPIVSELLQSGAKPNPRQKHFVAVRDGDEKFVLGTDGAVLRFNLAEDPGETQPVPVDYSELTRRLERAGIDFDYEAYASPEFSEPTPRMRANLKALGYIR